MPPTKRSGLDALVSGLLLLTACTATQVHTPPHTAAPDGGQSLGQAADDPTASLMSLQVADWYTADYHNLSGASGNSVVLRPVVPFKTGELKHILRATVPFVTESPALATGLSDTTLFDLIVFDQEGWRWGIGPVLLMPTGGSSSGADQWALGPAVGFTAQHGHLLWGLFNQNLFSIAGDATRPDVGISSLQPIFTYGLGDGWSTGFSEMSYVYDWEASRWSSIPLGFKLAKLLHPGSIPVQFNLQYEYGFADQGVSPESTLRFTFKFLFPT